MIYSPWSFPKCALFSTMPKQSFSRWIYREKYVLSLWLWVWVLEKLVIMVNKPSKTGFKDRQSSPAGCYMMRALIIKPNWGGWLCFRWKIRSLSFARRERTTFAHLWCNPAAWLRGNNNAFVGCWMVEMESVFLMKQPRRRDTNDFRMGRH